MLHSDLSRPMKFLATFACVVLAFVSTDVIPGDLANHSTFSLEARVLPQTSKGVVAQFTLTNRSRFPQTVLRHQLPWGSVRSMIFSAVARDGAIRLPSAKQPFDDAIANEVVIPAMSSLVGEIPLRSQIENIDMVVKSEDVLVFWSYVPETRDGKRYPRLSGHLELPRRER